MRAHDPSTKAPDAAGFSLVELAITIGILGVLTALAIPQYTHALELSRFTKSRQELRLISIAIDSFKITRGRLPLSLQEIGYGGRIDPWGNPYCYLNYGAGTGDGLTWAIDTGIVDPLSLPNSYSDSTWDAPAAPVGETETALGGTATSGGSDTGKPDDGHAYAFGHIRGSGDKAVTADTAPSEEALVELGISVDDAPAVLGKIEGKQVFMDVDVPTVRRRNQYMFPLNTDYDLFSLGPNGVTAAALNDPTALDDVIRANNGGFFGNASDY